MKNKISKKKKDGDTIITTNKSTTGPSYILRTWTWETESRMTQVHNQQKKFIANPPTGIEISFDEKQIVIMKNQWNKHKRKGKREKSKQ